MNISELARQVRLSTKEVRALFPVLGFNIGARAIKVDPRVAGEVIKILNNKTQREKYLALIQEGETEEPKNLKIEEFKELKEEDKNIIKIPQWVAVKDLAQKLNINVTKLVVELMKQGVMASLNDKIDFETACIISEDFGFKTKLAVKETKPDHIFDLKDIISSDKQNLKPRPPVVVVMGHVDHGKTKLLDSIRKTNVVDQESGGITQHIGAYQTTVHPNELPSRATQSLSRGSRGISQQARNDCLSKGQTITFIDTPGHEAFSMMRSRGARVADLAILVVAADDGVQPQTIEAISHIKKVELPFIVAINKIDKSEANKEKIMKELSEINVVAEDWGGDVAMIPISAKFNKNIQELLENLLLIYEVEKEKISADPTAQVIGVVIESHIDKGAGPIATILVKNGTLKLGQDVVIGDIPGRIRLMSDWEGNSVQKAEPSKPVAVLGLKSAPQVGEILKEAQRGEFKKTSRQFKKRLSAATLRKKTISEEKKEIDKINLIVKADVLGSLEALQESLLKLNSEDIIINIIGKGLGYITEIDVLQAVDCDALVLGFNVLITPEAEELARIKSIIIKSFNIIYDFIDFVAEIANKKLKSEITRYELGKIKVLKIFRQEKGFVIVGGKVISGEILNNTKIEQYRNKQRLGAGSVIELQSGKEVVNQVVLDQEAGLKITGINDIQIGDKLVVYQEEEKERKLEL